MKTLKLSLLVVILTSILYSCQKEYSLEAKVTPAGTWQFNDATKLYKGNIDTAYIEASGSTKTMNLVGRSEDGLQNFLLHLYDVDTFTVGSYKASLFENDFFYSTQAKTLYQADQFIGEFIVNITAIGNNSVTGTFSGDAEDSSGTIKPLTLGKFTARINLSGNGTGGGGGNTAVGTLGGSPNACTGTTPAGTYTQGIALGSSNTATIQVNVTTPGSYSISSNTANGVTFSKSGTFSATGTQSVVLNGSGIPANSGSQVYTVTFGSSSCTFTINYLPGIVPVGDYFPTNPGSFWAYGNNVPTDSFLVTATSQTRVISGQTYNVFTYDGIPASGSPDSLFYRKAAGKYYETINTEEYFFDPGSSNNKNLEYVFLDEAAAQGATWSSPNSTGTFQGTSVTIYIKATVIAKSVSATSGVVTSNDVIKMKYEYFASSPGVPAFVFYTEERWYAKGIGLIYNSFDDGSGADIYKVGRYKIN